MSQPKNDPEFQQKFFLISFSSENGKREKNKTFGIKLYGGFETQQQGEEYINLLKSEGDDYFDIFLDQMGKWVSFPDNQEVNSDSRIFLNTETTSGFDASVDMNSMYKELNENFKKKQEYENNIKKIIRTKTMFEKPETEEENTELINYLYTNLIQKKQDIEFFKQSINNNIDKLKIQKELEEKEKEDSIKDSYVEPDFIYQLQTDNTPQKFALVSFVDETTPRQKGKTFMLKVRGCFSTEEELQQRKQEIMSFDSCFDLYKVPLGQWLAFKNEKHFYPETLEELNKILYDNVQFLIKNKKDFENRITKAKNKEEVEEVVFTSSELENIISRLKDKVKECSELYSFLIERTKKYLTYSTSKFEKNFTEEQLEELKRNDIHIM